MVKTFFFSSADVSVELGRAVHINLNPENVKELTEFMDGLVMPGEGTKNAPSAPTGRTLFLRCFNLCTADMFVQLVAPSQHGNPKLLGSLAGVRATAIVNTDQQGK